MGDKPPKPDGALDNMGGSLGSSPASFRVTGLLGHSQDLQPWPCEWIKVTKQNVETWKRNTCNEEGSAPAWGSTGVSQD